MYFNIMKATYDRPIANIILDSEKLFQNKTRMPTLTTYIQHTIESPSQSSWARKGNKRHPSGKGRSKIVTVCR